MDKQKQIEEMAKYCCGGCEMSWGCDDGDCAEKGKDGYKNCGLAKGTAEKLYNAGYRKIPEGAVVLTREEYERLLKEETLCERLGNDIDVKLKYIYELEDKVAQIRKETAEKFAGNFKQRMKDKYQGTGLWWTEIVLMAIEICEEINEGKV